MKKRCEHINGCAGFVLEIVLITQGMFLLLLSSAGSEKRPFLLLTHATREDAGGAQESGRGHSRDS